MIKDVHYNSTIAKRLTPLIVSLDTDGIIAELSQLSNSQYRTAGYMLGEKLLDELPADDYWTIANALISFDSKAFMVTLLKGFCKRLEQGTLSIHDDGFVSLCKRCNDIEAQKMLELLLPLLCVDDALYLFGLLGKQEPSAQLQHLLGVSTLPCRFLLFRSLKYCDHDRAFLIRATHFLIKRGDSLSFNLASLLKVYFGLDEVKNTFSLKLEPYQLSRIENSFEVFCDVMRF